MSPSSAAETDSKDIAKASAARSNVDSPKLRSERLMSLGLLSIDGVLGARIEIDKPLDYLDADGHYLGVHVERVLRLDQQARVCGW